MQAVYWCAVLLLQPTLYLVSARAGSGERRRTNKLTAAVGSPRPGRAGGARGSAGGSRRRSGGHGRNFSSPGKGRAAGGQRAQGPGATSGPGLPLPEGLPRGFHSGSGPEQLRAPPLGSPGAGTASAPAAEFLGKPPLGFSGERGYTEALSPLAHTSLPSQSRGTKPGRLLPAARAAACGAFIGRTPGGSSSLGRKGWKRPSASGSRRSTPTPVRGRLQPRLRRRLRGGGGGGAPRSTSTCVGAPAPHGGAAVQRCAAQPTLGSQSRAGAGLGGSARALLPRPRSSGAEPVPRPPAALHPQASPPAGCVAEGWGEPGKTRAANNPSKNRSEIDTSC